MQGTSGSSWLWSLGLGALCIASCSFDSAPITRGATVSPPSTAGVGNGSAGQSGAGAAGQGSNGAGTTGAGSGNAGSGGNDGGSGGSAGTRSNAGQGGGSAGRGGTGGSGGSAGSSAGSGGTGGTGGGGSGGTGSLLGCANPLREGSLCDDSTFCTVEERCHLGQCTGGKARNCDALADACNAGECDEAAGTCKRKVDREGLDCSDGLFCTVGDACFNGLCVAGGQRDCMTGAPACHVGSCDENTDACKHVPGLNGTACGDGLPCTDNEVCDNGSCSAELCANNCQGGACAFACNGIARCETLCDGFACTVDCTGSDKCTLGCRGASCGVDCHGVSQCNAKCEAGTCTVDCRGAQAGACTAIECSASTCTILCDQDADCGFKECNTAMECPDGSVVCGKTCDPLPP